MINRYEIPSEIEVNMAQRETVVKLTIEVEGGALPDDQRVIFVFSGVRLTRAGQLEIEIEEGELTLDQLLADDSWRHAPDRRFSLALESGLISGEDQYGQPAYTMRVETKR